MDVRTLLGDSLGPAHERLHLFSAARVSGKIGSATMKPTARREISDIALDPRGVECRVPVERSLDDL